MPPPGPPGMPAPPAGNGKRRRMFTSAPKPVGAEILVQAYGGFGELAQFRPATGGLQPAALAMQAPGGVFGELDGVSVVFYRGADGLALRVGDRLVDLESSMVSVTWEPLAEQRIRFAVTVAGTLACELRYRAVPAERDVGLLIRDVCADPDRRERIFAR